MTDTKRTNSVYFRTIISLIVCTIFVFALLCIIYYQQITKTLSTEEASDLYDYAVQSATGYDKVTASLSTDDAVGVEDAYLTAIAQASGTAAWVVSADGTISYATEIPAPSIAQLIQTDGIYKMAPVHMQGLTDPQYGGVISGSQNGLFTDPKNIWLSAAYPVDGGKAFLILHKSLDIEQEAIMTLSNALAIPVLISFATALLLFTFMTRAIVRPIRLLSDVARKVKNGDLAARIKMPEQELSSPVQFALADEITDMITSVNEMIERLESQENDRRVFVSSIAHDIRTPLTSVKGFLSAMLDGTIPPEQMNHYLEITKAEVDRIQSLTASMSEVSSLRSVDELKIASFDINEIIQQTLVALEGQLKEKNLGVQLETDRYGGECLLARGDKEAISRVVHNLLVNAIKFTPQNGDIAVTTQFMSKKKMIYVLVEDSGPGIPQDKRSRIFESFYKLDSSRTNPGSGLGLFICKEILLAHGQSIQVDDSPVLGGARFLFTLDSGAEL